jgi:hypothetical protein
MTMESPGFMRNLIADRNADLKLRGRPAGSGTKRTIQDTMPQSIVALADGPC